MSDFGDTTGMQNPIFRIMNNQSQQGQTGQQGLNQNPMNLMNINPSPKRGMDFC